MADRTFVKDGVRYREVDYGPGSPPFVYPLPTDAEISAFVDNEMMDPSGVQYFVSISDHQQVSP